MKRQTNESCGILAPYLLPTDIIMLAPAKQILEETALLIFLVSGAGQGAGGGEHVLYLVMQPFPGLGYRVVVNI